MIELRMLVISQEGKNDTSRITLNTQTVKVSQIRWYYFKNGYMNPLHYYPIHFAATYDLCCATIIVQRIFAPVLVRYYFNYCLYMC